MNILLTGDKGFVGRNTRRVLEAEGHQMLGLEVTAGFREWYDNLHSLDTSLGAVIHAGAISSNQYANPDIFIWNSYASLTLAKFVRDRYGEIPFVFFSSFQVSASDIDERSWYGWSKAFAEDCIKEVLPNATILRPGVMWGDEKHKPVGSSVPYQLATHQLTHLYTNWGRDYVFVDDAVEAVKIGIYNKPAGTFNLNGEYWRNEDLATLTDWKGYELVENPAELGVAFNNSQYKNFNSEVPSLPGWTRIADLRSEFKRIEKENT